MKAVLWIIGIAIVVVGIGFGITRLFSDLSDRSESAKTFATTVAADVTKSWDSKALQPYADEAYFTSVITDTGKWASYALLGPAVSAPECRVPNIKITNGKAGAEAVCSGEFEKGSGALQIFLSDYSGQWRVVDLKLQL